jgi:hypothetical protein
MRNPTHSIFLSVLSITLSTHCGAATPKDAIVKIKAGFELPDGQKNFLSKASGFLVSKEGIVVTAKHALDVTIPSNAKLVIEGASPSKDSKYYTLYKFDPMPTNVDITTLRFSPALNIDWPFLNVSVVDPSEGKDVVAWGFPFDQERIGHPGTISGVQGIDPTLLPMSATVIDGMSGGPVVDASDGKVIGVITGGGKQVVNGMEKDVPLNYMTPIKYDVVALTVLGVRSGAKSDTKVSQGLVNGTVDVYPPGNAVTAPHRAAVAGEAIVQALSSVDEQFVDEEATGDGGAFTIKVIDTGQNPKVDVWAQSRSDAATQGELPNYVSNPVRVDVSDQHSPVSIALWDRARYIVNTRQSAETAASNIVKNLPACLHSDLSGQRAQCIDQNPHLLDPLRNQIEEVRGDYLDILHHLGPRDVDNANLVALRLAIFSDNIGDPCGSVNAISSQLPLPNSSSQADLLRYLTTWVAACIQTAGFPTKFDLPGDPISKATWALKTIQDALGPLRADSPVGANAQVVIPELLTLFESVADANYSAAEQIARSPTLDGFFEYFLVSWANPGCGLTLSDGTAAQNQTALDQIRKYIAAGRCHGVPTKRLAVEGQAYRLLDGGASN